MGSPVSAVVANLYMEFFEELALGSAPVKPRLWKRYVDDTCCIVKRGMAEELLDHLNSVRPSIQFTLELEREGSLPFLDTLLRRREDGTLDISVYRKPTHTDRYLHFRSHHPTHVRRGLVRCLFNRARSITTSPDSLQKEEGHLASVLKCNGFPSAFIRASSTPPTQPAEDTRREQPEGRDKPPLVVLPYVSGASEDIRHVCGWYNLRVVFRLGRTLRSMLIRVKDTLPLGKHSNVVYQILCGGCSKVYIGETIRRLETRLKEHQEVPITGMTEKSAVAEHAWNNRHSINWEEMSIIDQARRHKELLLKEALHMHMTPADQRIN